MDVARFGLSRRPFRPVPAPEVYFPAAGHEGAISALKDAFDAGDGIAVLDGGPGTGKTLVALRLLEALAPDCVPLFVPSAKFAAPAEFHQAVLFDLGKPYLGLTPNELRLAVTEHLLAGRRTVLVLDEAHHMGPDLLEEVRLLDNLETKGAKAVLAVLVGPPALRERVESMPALAQRVGTRARLDPLLLTEAVGYLRHQIAACGGGDEAFTGEALELIAAHAGGVPRVLNRLAGSALVVAAEAGAESVDVEAAYEALARAGVSVDAADEPAPPAYAVGAERSRAGPAGEPAQAGEPAAARQPKQPARKRRSG